MTTSWSYTYFSGTVRIEQRTTTNPVVTTAQNGSNSTTVQRELYDEFGYLIATQDERGYINQYHYDNTLGVMTQQVVDDNAPSGSGWTANSGTRLQLTSDFEYDAVGRQTQSLGPTFNMNGTDVRTATWTVYDDVNYVTMSGRGFATGTSPSYTYTLVNPVSLSRTDADGRVTDTVQSIRSSTSGRLTINDETELATQANWCRWTHMEYQDDGLLAESRVYHLIPSSGSGSQGTNYEATFYGYDDMNRQCKVTGPAGTITWTVFDVRGLAVQTFVGTNSTGGTNGDPTGGGATGNNMVMVVENEYDDGSDGGNGNVTSVTRPVDNTSGNDRITELQYDFRDRQKIADGPLNFYQKVTYNNLDQVTKSEQYNDNESGNLLAQAETFFDNRNRVYQSKRYAVNSSGTLGNALVDNTWYDGSGNVIKSLPAGSQLFTKTLYDGAGRAAAQYQGYYTGTGTEPYSDVGQVTSSNRIYVQSISTYDKASNLTFAENYQRFHNTSGEGALNYPNGSAPLARVSYQAMWYDGIGRSIATANYGTSTNAGPPARPNSPPSSSSTSVILSQTSYNSRGEVETATDPEGTVTQTTYDNAGRVTQTVQDYGTGKLNITTQMTYHASGQIATLTAVNADTGNQVTTYTYGTTLSGGSTIASNDLLAEVEYP